MAPLKISNTTAILAICVEKVFAKPVVTNADCKDRGGSWTTVRVMAPLKISLTAAFFSHKYHSTSLKNQNQEKLKISCGKWWEGGHIIHWIYEWCYKLEFNSLRDKWYTNPVKSNFFFLFWSDRMGNDQWLGESTSECWPWEEGTRVIDGLLRSASCPHINCASLPHLQSYIRLSIWHCFLASCSGNKTSSCSGPRQPRWMPVMVVVVGNEAYRRTPGREEEPMLFPTVINFPLG